MRFEYDYSQWPLNNDKDNGEDDGGNSGIYERGLFPFTMPSEVWNGAFSSSSSLDGGWQTAQVIPPPPRTLDAATCSPYATLDHSLLVARYSGKANNSFDVGTVLADGEEKKHLIYIFAITGLKLTTPPSYYTGPIPKDVAVFYFEATFNTLNEGTDRTRENDNGDDPMESSEPDNEIDNNQGEGSVVQESEDRVERGSTRRGGRAEQNNTYDSIGGCIGLVGANFPLER